MSKTTTNLLLMLITIVAGTYFYITSCSECLSKVEEATNNVEGHTDDKKISKTNMNLGLARANFAKNYRIRNGISDTRINTSSKGEIEPIESNATEEGTSKNSTTIVTLNK
ncbi:OmpA family protein [Maribacter sp. CXY002]|uniref:OmpA family protein n=1 Tax=Maribacter luteocoastalis TaxID=3407671 RepID=UPI003B676905